MNKQFRKKIARMMQHVGDNDLSFYENCVVNAIKNDIDLFPIMEKYGDALFPPRKTYGLVKIPQDGRLLPVAAFSIYEIQEMCKLIPDAPHLAEIVVTSTGELLFAITDWTFRNYALLLAPVETIYQATNLTSRIGDYTMRKRYESWLAKFTDRLTAFLKVERQKYEKEFGIKINKKVRHL